MLRKTDTEQIQDYLTDSSHYTGQCEAVYFPETAEEAAELLKEAQRNGTPVTLAGNGTGLTGARVPDEGIVIATEKMTGDPVIAEDKASVTLPPAVVMTDLQNLLRENGLLYPPDPTETTCYVGGTIATNASGAKTFRYGPTRDYVQALELALPDGELLRLRRGEVFADGFDLTLSTESGKKIELHLPDYEMPKTKNASGYFCKKDMDAIDLFIGSEGTLGLITRAELKVLPLPQELLSCVAFFPDEEHGLDFVEKARDASYATRREGGDGINARAIEFFDNYALEFLAEEYPNEAGGKGSAVWIEQELTEENEEELTMVWFELIESCGGDTDDIWAAMQEADREKIRHFRHHLAEKVNEYTSKKKTRKLGTDVAVPDAAFREYYHYSKEIVEKTGIKFVVYGHFGNSHSHLNILPDNQEEAARGKKAYDEIVRRAVELGGTVSAEHGIGKVKPEYLRMMYGDSVIEQMAGIKKALDPAMILGRGTIFGRG